MKDTCYNCSQRQIGCHSHCDTYKDALAEDHHLKALDKTNNPKAFNFYSPYGLKSINKNLRKFGKVSYT